MVKQKKGFNLDHIENFRNIFNLNFDNVSWNYLQKVLCVSFILCKWICNEILHYSHVFRHFKSFLLMPFLTIKC